MTPCVHSVGIYVKESKYVQYRCVECFKFFNSEEAMDQLERIYGVKGWQPEWVKLREMREELKDKIRRGYTVTTEKPIKL